MSISVINDNRHNTTEIIQLPTIKKFKGYNDENLQDGLKELERRVIQSDALSAIKTIDKIEGDLLIKCRLLETFYLRISLTEDTAALGTCTQNGHNAHFKYHCSRVIFVDVLAKFIFEVAGALREEKCKPNKGVLS